MSKSYDKYRVVNAPDNRNDTSSSRLYDKYRLAKRNQIIEELPSNSEVVAKSLASGVLSNLDIPQTVGSIALNPEYGLFGMGRKLYHQLTNQPHTKLPGADYIEAFPSNIVSNSIKSGIRNVTGVGLNPQPANNTQKLLSHAGEFAGSIGPFGVLNKGSKLLNIGKTATTGAAIGSLSGGAQALGANPMAADIVSSLAVPAALGGSKNILNKFSKEHRDIKTKQKVADALRNQIGEEHLPQVLEDIQKYKRQKKPINLQPITPEIAQNAGLSRLYRTQTNTPSIPARFAENDLKLKEALESLGTTGLEESVKGEAIRQPFVERFARKKQRRADLTAPLYEELEAVQEGINPAIAQTALEKELAVSSPGNKAPLERYLKNLERNQISPVDMGKIKELRSNLKSIDKDYKDLNPQAISQLKAPILEELAQVESSRLPRPIQIENTIQELGDKVNSLSRSGEVNAARKYGSIKKAYEADLAKHPLGLKHREEYKRLSKPLNEIETSSLLNNFIKQNKDVSKLEGFVVPSEKIPALILDADLNNTKILINKTKNDKELLNLVKGTYIDKLLETTTLQSGNFSYDKAKRFLDNKYNREKIDVIFNNQERKKLDQFLNVLEKRSKMESLGKVSGSDTHQKFKVDNEFNNSLGFLNSFARKSISKATGTGKIGEIALDTAGNIINKIKNHASNNLLEEVLLDPNAFKRLMSKEHKTKTFQDFYEPMPAILPAIALEAKER